jgi:hypothetical protein
VDRLESTLCYYRINRLSYTLVFCLEWRKDEAEFRVHPNLSLKEISWIDDATHITFTFLGVPGLRAPHRQLLYLH